jgi:hypothetical protein
MVIACSRFAFGGGEMPRLEPLPAGSVGLQTPEGAGFRGSLPMPHYENDRIVETPTEARAGVTGQNARYVLAFGTVGVIALFAVVYLYYFV